MNQDRNPEQTIDTELQVRLLNLVVGEASDFERDQLQQVMENHPEVATYYRQLGSLNSLLQQLGASQPVGKPDDASPNAQPGRDQLTTPADDAEWHLPADKRQQLLAVLEGQGTAAQSALSILEPATSPRLKWSRWVAMGVTVAAAACLLIGLMLPAVQSAREAPRRMSMSRAEKSVMEGGDAFYSYATPGALDASASSPPAVGWRMQEGAPAEGFTRKGVTPPADAIDGLAASGDVADGSVMLGAQLRSTIQRGSANQPSPDASQSPLDARVSLATPRILMTDEVEPLFRVDDFEANQALNALRNAPARWYKQSEAAEEASLGQLEKRASDKKFTDQVPVEAADRPAVALGVPEGGPGDVPIEHIEDLDLVIIKGAKRDVDRTLKLMSEMEGKINRERKAAVPSTAVDGENRWGFQGKSIVAGKELAIQEQTADVERFSTFSLHVSDVSFKLAESALAQGQWPAADQVRIEEFVNAFDYHDPLPGEQQQVACVIEQSRHPFLMQRNLMRISMRTAAKGRSANTPLRLTLLLDNSGSMERPDRRAIVRQAFQTLCDQLTEADQITLISFASSPRLLADKVIGSQSQSLVSLIENLPAEGGTNIESALALASQKALEQKLAGAQNRIVLLTDGAVNLGNANPESLARQVTQLRDMGIAFDAAGISSIDVNDNVLEALSRQGDGRYYLLDSADAAGESFATQIAGALRPSAQNVKVQVEFNPLRVGRYKLLGFDKHRLQAEDFRNDQVDAAELAATEAGVAVYQFEVNPNGSGDVGQVSVRFRDIASDQMVERRWPIPYESSTPRLDQATESMRLATCAALFGAKLSGGALAESVDLSSLPPLLANLSQQFANQPRVQQLRTMISQAMALKN